MKLSIKDVSKFYTHGAHDVFHVKRVYYNALELAKTLKCDIEVVKASALLHDVARFLEDEKNVCHAQEGAKMAEKILKKYDYSPLQVSNIIHCIKVHRYSKDMKPETVEAKILQDADRLDTLGAITIGRVFHYAGGHNEPMHDPKIKPHKTYKKYGPPKTAINHFFEKILKIQPKTFQTKKARDIAQKKYKFTTDFIKKFLNEWK
ncbi:MAG: HD domain-containing protein [Candidatus Nanoarchaeia archaeon]|jgi:uncharacterized protein